MIETRLNRNELKRLTKKYRDNYNHDHVLKIDTAQKLDIVDAVEFDSSTALYYLVNLVFRILKNQSLSLYPMVAMLESQNSHRAKKKKKKKKKKLK